MYFKLSLGKLNEKIQNYNRFANKYAKKKKHSIFIE